MGDRDRADGRADVGLGGDGLDGAGVAAGAAYGVDALVLRMEELPGVLRPGARAAPRMARLRGREGRR